MGLSRRLEARESGETRLEPVAGVLGACLSTEVEGFIALGALGVGKFFPVLLLRFSLTMVKSRPEEEASVTKLTLISTDVHLDRGGHLSTFLSTTRERERDLALSCSRRRGGRVHSIDSSDLPLSRIGGEPGKYASE